MILRNFQLVCHTVESENTKDWVERDKSNGITSNPTVQRYAYRSDKESKRKRFIFSHLKNNDGFASFSEKYWIKKSLTRSIVNIARWLTFSPETNKKYIKLYCDSNYYGNTFRTSDARFACQIGINVKNQLSNNCSLDGRKHLRSTQVKSISAHKWLFITQIRTPNL